jgi:hypothetical protein
MWLVIAVLAVVAVIAVFTIFDNQYFVNADGTKTAVKTRIFGLNESKK